MGGSVWKGRIRMLSKEREFLSPRCSMIVGIDEAGRGPLAGPVYAAAVLFRPDYENPAIDDSKKLTAKKREALYEEIIASALGYGIAAVSAEEIDAINIYEATRKAMRMALSQINAHYDLIITDAMPFSDLPKPVIAMVKGDAQCLNVAAASILAKVSRDRYMDELDRRYPEYGFAHHKGYGTKEHLAALDRYGAIEGVHRKSFAPVQKKLLGQMSLF